MNAFEQEMTRRRRKYQAHPVHSPSVLGLGLVAAAAGFAAGLMVAALSIFSVLH